MASAFGHMLPGISLYGEVLEGRGGSGAHSVPLRLLHSTLSKLKSSIIA